MDALVDVRYVVDGMTFDDLGGHVAPGDEVKAVFELADGCDNLRLSLASYQAPNAAPAPGDLDELVLFDSATGQFDAPGGDLGVVVPSCFFHVAFVLGEVLVTLDADGYGERLVDSAGGGSSPCAPTSTTSTSPPPTSTSTSTSPPPTSSTTSSTAPPPAECPVGMDRLEDVHYTVDGVRVDELAGNVQPGDEVVAHFTVAQGCQNLRVSLAAYSAPDATPTPDQFDDLALSDSDSGLFDAGEGSLSVDVPSCFFHVAFAIGPVLAELDATGYGANLVGSASGGSGPCAPPPTGTSTTTPPPTSTGTGTATSTGTATTGPPRPTPLACPSDLLARGQEDGSILVTFTPTPGSDATQLYRRDATGEFSLIATLDPGVAQYHDTDVVDDMAYSYRTDAMQAGVQSAGCPVAEAIAVPDFPTLMALGLAVAGAVGPLAWRTRRKK